jgi:hypothetical protein
MKTITYNNKEYSIPERMGLLPTKKYRMIQAIPATDPDIDLKQISLILNEPLELIMDIPMEEYIKLSREIYSILLSDVKPELLDHIEISDVK